MSEPFEIRTFGSKGRCAFASRSISKGEILVSEIPFVCAVDSKYCNGPMVYPQFSLSEMEKQMLLFAKTKDPSFNGTSIILAGRLVVKYLTNLDAVTERQISDLHSSSSFGQYDNEYQEGLHASAQILQRLVENCVLSNPMLMAQVNRQKWPLSLEYCVKSLVKIGLNAFQVPCSYDNCDCLGGCLCLRTALFNHSCCQPNAIHSFNAQTGQMMVRAARTIAVGEEITISYINCLYKPSWMRRAELLQSFHFLCCCDACVSETDETVTHDTNGWLCQECKRNGVVQCLRLLRPISCDQISGGGDCDGYYAGETTIAVDGSETVERDRQAMLFLTFLKYPKLLSRSNSEQSRCISRARDMGELKDLITPSWLLRFNRQLQSLPYPDAADLFETYGQQGTRNNGSTRPESTCCLRYICPRCCNDVDAQPFYTFIQHNMSQLTAGLQNSSSSSSSLSFVTACCNAIKAALSQLWSMVDLRNNVVLALLDRYAVTARPLLQLFVSQDSHNSKKGGTTTHDVILIDYLAHLLIYLILLDGGAEAISIGRAAIIRHLLDATRLLYLFGPQSVSTIVESVLRLNMDKPSQIVMTLKLERVEATQQMLRLTESRLHSWENTNAGGEDDGHDVALKTELLLEYERIRSFIMQV